MLPQPSLCSALSRLLGRTLQPDHFHPLGGGSINEVYRIEHKQGQPLVLKVNSAAQFPQLFSLEAAGLEQLKPHIRVPQVVGLGEEEGIQYLVLEWIAEENPTPFFWKRFGEALAALHSVKGPYFGAAQNNYMGAVPQNNTPCEDWSRFFAQCRLLPLSQRCAEKGLLPKNEADEIERVCLLLPGIFTPTGPTLVHGDLWSGNFLCGKEATPVLIDPAVYFGHPSVDLGMTTLFGGFPASFYEAYHYHSPLPQNHKEQWELCNLYPLLIHLLLFGPSYLGSIKRILQQFTGIKYRSRKIN